MKTTLEKSINQYIKHCKTTDWVFGETYKFEFANYIYYNVDWKTNSDEEILGILKHSQSIRFTSGGKTVQFLRMGAREKPSEFIKLKDVELFRSLQNKEVKDVDWSERSMSYPVLSAWLASLFPEKIYPVPKTGFQQPIHYLFGTSQDHFPQSGLNYILKCQPYFSETEEILKSFPIEELHLEEWNKYYRNHPELKIPIKEKLEKIDWVWMAQDFLFFVYWYIFGLDNKKQKKLNIQEDPEPTVVEGKTRLANHLRKERNASLIQKKKEKALRENPMLNCEVCGFSFSDAYGPLGEGFIEAHHKNPLSLQEEEIKTRLDDIALVCSNCHRMLHKEDPVLSVEELKRIIDKE